ncbi:hypothetical protein DSCO28_64090 [Desulfosarcina ovata subsp. sediminis]|uniref:Filamentous haemagglutinin FhaB/tRNA nuclease CdiA-like TPS domain-containing protein n=1 Tax=Desulfosarcina ovata subsp. sediminis TaxID=885957 RepID=A0A5K8A008_9BACT|nr:filamentous haemagglutinin family protein [Desulfosarcina ovata]BBO85843.1 hypothetical protein DSCO28_64090 [Desulfosarcina ovata subsp. sediminis]
MKPSFLLKRLLAFILALDLIIFPMTLAAQNIPGFYGSSGTLVQPSANQLPVIQSIVSNVSSLEQVGNNKLIVHQTNDKAVLEWKSFDIGANAWTHFDQQGNTNWSALNRIYDQNPSQIFGRLTADGSVYLINQNGILFSQGSSVDVHGLVASSLNIAQDAFEDDLMTFAAENYQGVEGYDASAVAVSNHGTIETDNDGTVMLIASTVENNGTITAPLGTIILAAGSEVAVTENETTGGETYTVSYSGSATDQAVNFADGSLDAYSGYIGMFGQVVNQEGLVKAVTAIRQRGRIVLKATETLTLAEESLTTSPISDSDEAVVETSDYYTGEITLESEGAIDVKGSIVAPSGTVTISGDERVYLDATGLIDVSGSWVVLPAEEAVASVQLNSVELKDDYAQKDSILQGQTIYFNLVEGSSIGDVSGTLTTDEKTALERSTEGGSVDITSANGDVIARSGSTIDFSGGGLVYLDGVTNTTILISGTDVYTIADAPDNLDYDAIIGPDNLVTDTNERFGMSTSYDGVYHTGSASAVGNYFKGYIQGDDAGSLTVSAPVVLLNGTLDGSATAGVYQTEEAEESDENGYQSTLGIERPEAGTLYIGGAYSGGEWEDRDPVITAITISSESCLLGDDFDLSTHLSEYLADYLENWSGESIVSAELLSESGLSSITLSVIESIVVEADAVIELDPTGSLILAGRHIEHYGEIIVPDGEVSLILANNESSDDSNESYIDAETLGYERIYLGTGSLIDVSGEQVDLTEAAQMDGATADPGEIDGGTVILADWTENGEGVIVMPDATIDVSGGWRIDEDGTVSGGDAGTIQISGASIYLDGDLYAYALSDAIGGTLDLHTESITVTAETQVSALPEDFGATDPLTDEIESAFFISDDQIDITGASVINLASVTDLVVEDGVVLAPSTLRLAGPELSANSTDEEAENYVAAETSLTAGNGEAIVRVTLDEVGESAISLLAGKTLSSSDCEYILPTELTAQNRLATVRIDADAIVTVASQGTIDIAAPSVDIAGQVSAPAGTIELEATSADSGMALTIQTGATVSAAAYNLAAEQTLTTVLDAVYEALDGGTIALTAAADLIVAEGAVIDVSGSEPVDSLCITDDGSYQSQTIAGAPGTIEIAYEDDFQLQGELRGQATLETMHGGTLSVRKTAIDAAYELQSTELETYIQSGFDDITLASNSELVFVDSLDVNLERKITLDAPVISTSDQSIALNAPWIVLANTYLPDDESTLTRDLGYLSLSGDWIDITGDILLSGFDTVSLYATHDLRMADYEYEAGNDIVWSGSLETEADLIIDADRVYPTTGSTFAIVTGGDVTTRATTADPSTNPVYSAYGSLSLEAANIQHTGRWYAPMGQIEMTAEGGRIYLDDDSLLSVAGEATVNYGYFDDEGLVWQTTDKESSLAGASTEIEDAPEVAVTLVADEVIMRDDATVDVSGGGEVFGYQWIASVDGSTDPLDGVYVIVPGYSESLPGEAVYLEGNDLIEEGVYTILDESYAFVEGAIVIEDLGPVTTANAGTSLTDDGYAVSTGYTVVSGTDFSASQQHLYSVRSAEDVLAEGSYSVESITAGDAGTFSVAADTILLNGTYEAAPLAEEYSGGSLALSSQAITVSTIGVELPDGFTYTSSVPDDLIDQLIIDANAISDGNFGSVQLGDASLTETVDFEAGSTLEAENITITAIDSITVGADSLLSASGSEEDGGVLTLYSPEGEISVDATAALHATNEIDIETFSLDLSGDITVDNSILNLTSDAIFIVWAYDDLESLAGLVIDEVLWKKINLIDTISLSSRSEIAFMGNVDLTAAGTLILDSDSMVLDGGSVTIAASQIYLQNTSLTGETFSDTVGSSSESTGLISFAADDMTITLGEMADDAADDDIFNDLAILGAANLSISVTNNLVVAGEGTLSTEGDIDIESAAIVTALIETTDTDAEDATVVTTADIVLASRAGTVTTTANGNMAETDTGYGGAITLQGVSIDHGGNILSPAGTITLAATGSDSGDNVVLRSGSSLDAAGTENAAGGTVNLESSQGAVEVAIGAVVDVSAGDQGDAGTVSITAQNGSIQLLGDFYGQANGGTGGSFVLDNLTIDDFALLSDLLTGSGFSEDIDLRARTGDIAIDTTDSLAASTITMVADTGSVTVAGTLDASGAYGGGSLEIDAGQDIVISGMLNAQATDAGDGGDIGLYSTQGSIDIRSGSEIILSSSGENATGGSLYLRALRTSDSLKVSLAGDITGASKITVEGYAADESTTVTSTYLDGLVSDAANWLTNLNFTYTAEGVDDIFTVIAGIEIDSETDLSVSEAVDLSDYESQIGYGVLTLRSAGDLTVNENIIDARTDVLTLRESTAQDSWGINLVAGADLDSSDCMAVDTAAVAGQLTIADDVLVYTESGVIRFASADDTVMGSAGSQDPMTNASMDYNIGSFSGTIEGYTGGDLIFQADRLAGSGIQTATGDIRLTVSGDLVLTNGNYTGAIRTVGQAAEPDISASDSSLRELLNSYWSYTNGGSIVLDVGGDISGKTLASDAWDASSYNGLYYHAAYRDGGSKGIVTMAGGDVTIRAAGDVTSAVGLFGEGNLTVVAGGNLNGRFLISEGQALLSTLENFGTLEKFENQPIEAFDAQIELVAQGSIELGTVLNPTIANHDYSSPSSWDLTYTEVSSVSLTSVTGSVLLTGDTRFYDDLADQKNRIRILPANLTIDAAGDIILGNSFYLAPSATGNLILTAGGDIRSATSDSSSQVRYILAMSDVDPSSVYGVAGDGSSVYQLIIDGYSHDDALLHKNDSDPVTITAGGDVCDLLFYIPKASTLTAGGDIANIYYYAQNINLDDITVIAAGNDIYFTTGLVTVNNSGIEIGGPGDIVVSAGNSIDLGSSEGIRAVGGIWNPALPTPDEADGDPAATLTIYAGLGLDFAELIGMLDDTTELFNDIRELGQTYSEALAEGDTEGAQEILDDINENVIDPYFDGAETGEGNINMVNSEIYTSGNAGHIYMVATGEMNVGKSTFSSSGEENTGIYTTSGGSINIYVNGDLNVNESRVMTFLGGDDEHEDWGNITVWSQEGDINAGKGSKTAITASAPTIDYDENGDPYVVWSPPSVGSGIRALTYDPDGPEGSIEQPEAGDIYLFAAKGEIDAGEAGIAGSNIILAAIEVVNVQNIEVGGTAVGVPDTSLAATSLGALAGSGAVSETSKIAEEQAGLANAQERFSKFVEDISGNLVPKWIAVEVVGFGETDDTTDSSSEDSVND